MFDVGEYSFKSDIKLGEKYRDEQTKIEGTATSVTFFQHACERVCIELVVKGEMKEYVFDAPCLTHIRSGKKAKSARTGGTRPVGTQRGSNSR